MGDQSNQKDVLCVMWLVSSLLCGIVGMVWVGSHVLWAGYAVFGVAFVLGLLPCVLTGTITGVGAGRGFFAVIFLSVIQTFKVILMIFAFILTLGCMRCAGKKIKHLR